MYTRPDKHDYIDIKGIQLVRRDSCAMVKEASTAVLEEIMHRKQAPPAVAAARQHIVRLLAGECPVDKFVVSKALRGDYKNDKQPHLFVARKLAARRGFPVPSGTRVPYVFVEDLDNPDACTAERAEDPAHAAEQSLPLDALYYLEHQLWSPLQSLLKLMVEDPEAEVLGHPDVKPLLDALRDRRDSALQRFRTDRKRLRRNAARNQSEITSFYKKAPASLVAPEAAAAIVD
jgi:DNA polymerase delta subunit 1